MSQRNFNHNGNENPTVESNIQNKSETELFSFMTFIKKHSLPNQIAVMLFDWLTLSLIRDRTLRNNNRKQQ